MVSYWLKIVKFLYPPVFSTPRESDPIGISPKMFDTHKTRMIGLTSDEEIVTIH